MENIRETKKMDLLGIWGEFHFYSEQIQGCFNLGREEDDRYFLKTSYETDQFFTKHCFLDGTSSFQPNQRTCYTLRSWSYVIHPKGKVIVKEY